MVSAASGLLTTLHGLLGARSARETSRLADRLNDIRQAMLDCLGDEACAQFPQVERRVLFAADVHSLWYLRPELLMVVSSLRGERAAEEIVGRVSAMFEGLVPKSMDSRRADRGR